MSRRVPALAAIALTLVSAALLVAYHRDRTISTAPLVEFSTAPYDESQVRDRDIELYSRRLVEDAASALDRAALARLLFARAAAAGSTNDRDHGEALVRESIAARAQRNYSAFELLATMLMERHDFRAAKDVALQLDSLYPGIPSHIALLGEIELELGEYDSAASRFSTITYDKRALTTAARLARWYELTGRSAKARTLLNRAIIAADRRDDLPRAQAAWFHYRLGDLELRLGNIAAAESAFIRGFGRNSEDPRLLGGLARAAIARGKWHDAIRYGERATAVRLDPATLAAVSIAYAELGDSAQAASYRHAMSVSALKQPGPIHRAWGLFLLDHGTPAERADVLERARRELRDRKDVYGHDLMAWALFRNGIIDEARKEMQLALSQHTEDVMLADHARAIMAKSFRSSAAMFPRGVATQ